MINREESSWSLFQYILLVLAAFMLLNGVGVIKKSLNPVDYGVTIGIVMIGISAILILWWFILHSLAKRSMTDAMQLSETKYLTKLQKRAKRGFGITIGCTVFIVILAICLSIWYQSATKDMVNKVIALFAIPIFCSLSGFSLFYWIFCHTPYTKFSRYFKERFVLEVLNTNKNFTDLSYQLSEGFDMNEVYKMNLFCMGESRCYESEDMLRGKYRGKSFAFGDVKTGSVEAAGKVKYKVEFFKGQVAQFYGLNDMKKSDGLLLVREKSLDGPTTGSIEKVQTESIAFHDKFDVYAEKPLNAFYILTPLFIEKIIEISKKLEGELSLCFINNKLYAAINSKQDVFDPKVDMNLDEKKEKILYEDIKLIMEIVDVLMMTNES